MIDTVLNKPEFDQAPPLSARYLTRRSALYANWLKRPLDFSIALIGLLCISPLLLLLALLLIIFQGGNPIFQQERIGRGCRPFRIIKFRTMTNETDANGKLLPDEQRTTWVGKLMRSTSLDELPELINVLIGDMSLIGPRPWLAEKLVIFTEETKQLRMRIRPGVTGLAQILGRNGLTYRQRVSYDLRYQKHLSFSLDCKILFYTFYKVFKREGIYERPDALGKPAHPATPKDPETKGRKMNKPE